MHEISRRLHLLVKNGRLPPSLLFTGPDETVQEQTASQLAQYLFCKSPKDLMPCKQCLSCQKITKKIHPDFFILCPENKEIVIEQIRFLQKWLLIRPTEEQTRVAVISQSETMHPSSANALLKTLEEPASHVQMVLISQNANQLLPTIRSRLMKVYFPGVEKHDMDHQPSWLTLLDHLVNQVRPVSCEKIFDLTELVAKDKQHAIRFFEFVERQLIEDFCKASQEPMSGFRLQRIEQLFDLAIFTEHETIRRYGNMQLGLDRFLLQWLGIAS